jgi:hypothetical protein
MLTMTNVLTETVEAMLRKHLADPSAHITDLEAEPIVSDGYSGNELQRLRLACTSARATGAPHTATWVLKRWLPGGHAEHLLGIRRPLEALSWQVGLIRPHALPAVRSRLGAGRRRRLPQRSVSPAGHRGRLSRRRAAERGDRRGAVWPISAPGRARRIRGAAQPGGSSTLRAELPPGGARTAGTRAAPASRRPARQPGGHEPLLRGHRRYGAGRGVLRPREHRANRRPGPGARGLAGIGLTPVILWRLAGIWASASHRGPAHLRLVPVVQTRTPVLLLSQPSAAVELSDMDMWERGHPDRFVSRLGPVAILHAGRTHASLLDDEFQGGRGYILTTRLAFAGLPAAFRCRRSPSIHHLPPRGVDSRQPAASVTRGGEARRSRGNRCRSGATPHRDISEPGYWANLAR